MVDSGKEASGRARDGQALWSRHGGDKGFKPARSHQPTLCVFLRPSDTHRPRFSGSCRAQSGGGRKGGKGNRNHRPPPPSRRWHLKLRNERKTLRKQQACSDCSVIQTRVPGELLIPFSHFSLFPWSGGLKEACREGTAEGRALRFSSFLPLCPNQARDLEQVMEDRSAGPCCAPFETRTGQTRSRWVVFPLKDKGSNPAKGVTAAGLAKQNGFKARTASELWSFHGTPTTPSMTSEAMTHLHRVRTGCQALDEHFSFMRLLEPHQRPFGHILSSFPFYS